MNNNQIIVVLYKKKKKWVYNTIIIGMPIMEKSTL